MWIRFGVFIYIVVGLLAIGYNMCHALLMAMAIKEEDIGVPIRIADIIGSFAFLGYVLKWPYDCIKGGYAKLVNGFIDAVREKH